MKLIAKLTDLLRYLPQLRRGAAPLPAIVIVGTAVAIAIRAIAFPARSLVIAAAIGAEGA